MWLKNVLLLFLGIRTWWNERLVTKGLGWGLQMLARSPCVAQGRMAKGVNKGAGLGTANACKVPKCGANMQARWN